MFSIQTFRLTNTINEYNLQSSFYRQTDVMNSFSETNIKEGRAYKKLSTVLLHRDDFY